jgi:hypothetical protein
MWAHDQITSSSAHLTGRVRPGNVHFSKKQTQTERGNYTMATTEIVNLSDDLDPRIVNGVETVTFFHPAFGTKHEIELGEANRKHLANHLDKLQKYIDASREVVAPAPVKASTNKSDLTVVREWAKANGFIVGDRGRIKAEILAAYDASQMPTVVAGDKVELTVSPEAQAKLEEIAEGIDEAPEAENEPTDAELLDAEDSNETRELTDDEILGLMDNLDKSGEDVTLDKLTEAAKQA